MLQDSLPPGVCNDIHAHGPQRPIARLEFGPSRLRRLLGLSADVTINDLCDEAASEIEGNRGAGRQRVEPSPFEPIKRGPGRPRKEAVLT